MEKLGVPTYNELIFVARREALDEAGASRLRRFISATAAGHRRLREDPATGVDALLDADKGLERGLQEAVVQATLPVFFPSDTEKPWGWQEPVDWANYERWMRAEGLLKRPPNEAPPLTNEFLPGEGLGESARG
jgi:putative hydroxymethylpyrimidine transport system substrate-binding protein